MFRWMVLCCLFASTAAVSMSAFSDSFFEISAGARHVDIQTTQKRGANIDDSFSAGVLRIGAYRTSSETRAWGAVVEFIEPISRDDNPGDGHIVGVRPINFLVDWNPNIASEVYFGFAQYDWIETARGYYLGGNLRFTPGELPFSIAIDGQWYQDLAYDNAFGDLIVTGTNVGIDIIYRF